MIAMYSFDCDTAELMDVTRWQRGVSGAEREVVTIHDRTRECVGVSVREDEHAFEEMREWFASLSPAARINTPMPDCVFWGRYATA